MLRRTTTATLAILLAVLVCAAGCTATNAPQPRATTRATSAASPAAASATATPTAPEGFRACVWNVGGQQPAKPVDLPDAQVPATGTVTVTLTMTEGPVTITMDRAKTPCTVASFLSLAQQHYFDTTRCHRLADSGLFMLQCGDPTGTGFGGPGYQFADETYPTDTYEAGTVAMANAGPGTNGSQFFLVYQDSALPPSYTVFGRLDEASIGVVARMAAEGQDGSGADGTGKPNNPSEIVSVTVG